MARQKKKGESGTAKAYITRRKAMNKLQLSLKDFRRLCILKGIYPVEPKAKSKLGAGGVNKTYYLLSDIQYLSHDPVIWKFWEFKIFMRRLAKAKGRQDYHVADRIVANRPVYKVNHMVKERYPTLIDALRDLDDALSMCCLYSKFAKNKVCPQNLVNFSRRLTVEFMHYIVEARALRKVFVSIKGYYYQAEVMGQPITWVVPHDFVFSHTRDVDYKIMLTFTEFYVTLLGFVNFKLFASLNLAYPPKVASALSPQDLELLAGEDNMYVEQEYIAALSRPLIKTTTELNDTDQKLDEFEEQVEEGMEEVKSAIGLTFTQTSKLQKLFEGLYFFIGREVPREALVFVIRSFGGQVSWDKTSFIGATYDEKDPRITHHIIDRDVISNKYMNRFYIQPQWVFDSVNARTLLNVQDYFCGVPLPPHLSPFAVESDGDYISPEAVRLRELQSGMGQRKKDNEDADEEEIEDNEEEGYEDVDEEDDENESEEEVEEEPETPIKKGKKRSKPTKAEMQTSSGKKVTFNMEPQVKKFKKGHPIKTPVVDEVRPGKIVRENATLKTIDTAAEEKRLAVMMIPKKKKRLYDKIMFGKKRKAREVANLQQKRADYERQNQKLTKKSKK